MPARRLASVRLSGSVMRVRPSVARRLGSRRRPRIETTFVSSGRKVVPSAVPPSFGGVPHSDRRTVRVSHPVDRSALPCIAGALRRSLLVVRGAARRLAFGPEAPGSIRRRRHPGSHQPPGLWNGARRVLVPIKARLRDVARSLGAAIRGVKPSPTPLPPSRRRISGSHASPPRTWRKTATTTIRPGTDSASAGTCHANPSNAATIPASKPRWCPSWCRRPPARG